MGEGGQYSGAGGNTTSPYSGVASIKVMVTGKNGQPSVGATITVGFWSIVSQTLWDAAVNSTSLGGIATLKECLSNPTAVEARPAGASVSGVTDDTGTVVLEIGIDASSANPSHILFLAVGTDGGIGKVRWNTPLPTGNYDVNIALTYSPNPTPPNQKAAPSVVKMIHDGVWNFLGEII